MKPRELVVISGKGGAGKTSLTAAFACLAAREMKTVCADCDVDAADLHLILDPAVRETHPFVSGHEARIQPDLCTACGSCAQLCRFDGIASSEDGTYRVVSCEGCKLCVELCPAHAIDFPDRHCGEWYISNTRFGPLVHARLAANAENSGKLVTLVRKHARALAESTQASLVLIDGSPGIGCPVIASISGADMVLAVVEPTLSGLHDLERVAALAQHFSVLFRVIINKWDISEALSTQIAEFCALQGIPLAGRIPYDATVTEAQIKGLSILEYKENSPASRHIAAIWRSLLQEE